MFLDAKHDDLLGVIHGVARLEIQVQAAIEVVELGFAGTKLGFSIYHLVVVLNRSALIRGVSRIGSDDYVDQCFPLCISWDR
ncbi:hypothetical protein AOX63_05485 [Pseudomonas sp. ADP]|nr:hypothetical protein AOX63_05485 [Pseudomonas sp. ADP]